MGLSADRITVSRGTRQVLRDLSLELKRGEVVGILGNNGTGKSTLLSVLLGWLATQSGAVMLDGEPIAGLSPTLRAQRIAAVLQNERHAFSVSGRELVGLGRLCHGGDEDRDRPIVDAALEWADAAGFGERKIDTLSGGEWQRLLLARARAQQSPYWLLDEPTDGLDLAHQLELGARVRQMTREDGVGVLWVMHDPNFALRVCDRVCVLANAGAGYTGPMSELSVERLGELFGVRAEVVQHSNGRQQFWFSQPGPSAV